MKRITAPGIYDLTMEEYHSDCCDGPSVSGSRLHTIIDECPAVFWETSPLNPKRSEDPATKVFNVGRAVHALVLGEPNFNANFFVVPDGAPNKPSKKQRNAKKPSPETLDAIQFWDDVLLSKKAVVSEEDFGVVFAMATAQRRSPQVARAFENGKPERSLIWLDKETGVWLKSRPDWLPHDPTKSFLAQYKSADSIHPRALSAAAFKYGYHLGAAMECDGVRAVLGVEPLGIAHICQMKKPPYLAELKMFDVDQIEFGRREYRRALQLFARCWELHLAGKPERVAWPGYTVDAQYFETPYYIQKKMETPDGFDRYAGADRANADTARDFYAPI